MGRFVTLEFSNTTPLPAKIYANEGVAQVIFFESDEVCETSYKDRGGKYQGQQGVTLPRSDAESTSWAIRQCSLRAGPKVASVSIIAVCQVAAMALWFSASAIVPALVAEFRLGGFAQAALTSGVQAGFVLGCLVSAFLGLADRVDPRRLFATPPRSAPRERAAAGRRPASPGAPLLRVVTGVAWRASIPSA